MTKVKQVQASRIKFLIDHLQRKRSRAKALENRGKEMNDQLAEHFYAGQCVGYTIAIEELKALISDGRW